VYEALTARHRHYWANFLQTQAIREKASAHMTGASAISVQCLKSPFTVPRSLFSRCLHCPRDFSLTGSHFCILNSWRSGCKARDELYMSAMQVEHNSQCAL